VHFALRSSTGLCVWWATSGCHPILESAPACSCELHVHPLCYSWSPSLTPTQWMNWREFWTTSPFVHPWYQPWHLDDNQCAPLEVDPWGVMGLQVKVHQKKIQYRKRHGIKSCHSAPSSDRRRKPAVLREVLTSNPYLSNSSEHWGNSFTLARHFLFLVTPYVEYILKLYSDIYTCLFIFI
jgi:hypothetical protein